MNFLLVFDQESPFMAIGPGERSPHISDLVESIRAQSKQTNSRTFIAEREGKIIGYLEATGGKYKRMAHTTHLVMGVLSEFTGQSIGRKLLEAMEAWARTVGIQRVDLAVVSSNDSAIGLYLKQGFVIEGRKRKAMEVNGFLEEGTYMGKILE